MRLTLLVRSDYTGRMATIVRHAGISITYAEGRDDRDDRDEFALEVHGRRMHISVADLAEARSHAEKLVSLLSSFLNVTKDNTQA